MELLGTISSVAGLIVGIIALIVGSKAYYNTVKIKKEININYNNQDHSINAVGSVIYNGISKQELVEIRQDIQCLKNDNFDSIFNKIVSIFDEQYKTNLLEIINFAKHEIEKSSIIIKGYSKIDWINIYLESAKMIHDTNMQMVWAKILSLELEKPGSFSNSTLNVVKNLNSDDYTKFKKLIDVVAERFIFQDVDYEKYGLSYIDLLQLKEVGLLNMEHSKNVVEIAERSRQFFNYGEYIIAIKNTTDSKLSFDFPIFIITRASVELLKIYTTKGIFEYACEIANQLYKISNNLDIKIAKNKGISDETDFDRSEILYCVNNTVDQHKK